MCSLSIRIDSGETTLLHCEPYLLFALVATANPCASAATALPLPKIEPTASSKPSFTTPLVAGSRRAPPVGSTGVSCLCHGLQSPPNGHSSFPVQPGCGAHGAHGFAGSASAATAYSARSITPLSTRTTNGTMRPSSVVVVATSAGGLAGS